MTDKEIKEETGRIISLKGKDLEKAVAGLVSGKNEAVTQALAILKKEHEAEVASLIADVEELQKKLELPEDEKLKKIVAEKVAGALTDAEEKHATEVKKLTSEVDKLKTSLSKYLKNPKELNRCQSKFEVDGKEYRFKIGFLRFKFNGEVVTAEDAVKDKAMLEELVEIGFGGIEEIPSK